MNSTFYAHVRVGTCHIAIAAADIVQAVELAAAGLTPVPRREDRRCGALVGVVDHQGRVVPVVALDRWVPIDASSDATEKRVLILRSGSSLIAVQIDALMGVKKLAASAIHTVCRDGAEEELFEAVTHATADRPMLCLLQVSRLMALAAAWCEHAEIEPGTANPQGPNGAPAGPSGPVSDYAVFTIGDQRWGVPTACVAQVTKTPGAELRLTGQRVCAIGGWAQRKLPLVDLGHLHDGAGTDRPWMTVVLHGPLAIGLVVDRCDRVIHLTSDDIFWTPTDELRAGTAMVAGMGTVLLLDAGRLFDAIPEATISLVRAELDWKGTARSALPAGAPERVSAATATAAAIAPADDEAPASDYLVFEADRAYASPISGLMGVTMLTDDAVEDLSEGRRAAVTWRGETVGVVNMPSLDGGKAAFTPRLAVVVKGEGHDGRKSAIAVRSLTRWLAARSAPRSVMRMRSIGDVTVVTPTGGRRSESLVVVDLAQMAFLLD